MATIKVSTETYERLNRLAGKLREQLQRPVSMDEALNVALRAGELRPSDFSGTLLLDENEAAEIDRELDAFWSSWRPRRN